MCDDHFPQSQLLVDNCPPFDTATSNCPPCFTASTSNCSPCVTASYYTPFDNAS